MNAIQLHKPIKLDSAGVFNLYKTDKNAKIVLDYMTLKGKDKLTFKLKDVEPELKLSHASIISVFNQLDLLGLGLKMKGQRANRGTRFESFFDMAELEQAMHNKTHVPGEPVRFFTRYWADNKKKTANNRAKLAKIIKEKQPEQPKSDRPVQFNTLVLMPGVTISVPSGLSETDKKRLIDFVQIVN